MAESPDYAVLFRQMIVRGASAALERLGPAPVRLAESERERCLYLLQMALDLPEAWPAARDLTLALATQMKKQAGRPEWRDCLLHAQLAAVAMDDAAALAQVQEYLRPAGPTNSTSTNNPKRPNPRLIGDFA